MTTPLSPDQANQKPRPTKPAEVVQDEDCQQSTHEAVLSSSPAFLAGGGEMGERIHEKDWSQTPLGPVEHWPYSLKTVVRIMLTSRQPIWIGWGPDLIKLYNDPYKAIVGGKHPDALGQPASVVWREVWDDLGPRLQTALHENVGTYDESLLLIMERYGYEEETYYTFSYSPVPGDQGGVEGIICANTEDTRRIIGERQVKLLQTLAANTADARTTQDVCRRCAESLGHNSLDLPFALLYLLDGPQHTLLLHGTTGIVAGHPAAPETIALDTEAFWPCAEVMRTGKAALVAGLRQQFASLPTGAWSRPPQQAVVVPLAHAGQAGVLIVGLNSFRLFDDGYEGFIHLVAGQITASLANAQAYEEERKRVEAFAEIDRAKTVFFSNVSHEFRTPLTLLLGPIEEILLDPATQGLTQERAEIAHRNALRLLKLVNSLLDFSRIEAGRAEAVYEPTDLAALTADLASNFRSAIEKAGMHLVIACAPLDVPVYVDQEMWEKIVLNLLSNAFKYTLAGKITVTLERQETAVVLSIQDTGVGIPAEELPHMFKRFHRIKGSEGRTYEGTGIGLSLVQELVKLHGGTISVSSVQGEGSTFTIVLPLGMAHLPPERIAAPRLHASTAVNAQIYVEEALRLLDGPEDLTDLFTATLPPSDGHDPSPEIAPVGQGEARAHILFADDNADMRAYISRLLRQHYSVQTVSDGQAALAAANERRPDLVLTDVMMPGMDGFELLHALRLDPMTRTVPVLLLSARAGEEAKVEGLQAGADDYLVKPFSARELLARIGAHLEIARLRARLRAAIEQEVAAEREKLYSLFQQAPAAIAVLQGATLRYELANPRYQQVSARTAQQLIGKTIREVYPGAEGRGVVELLEKVFTSGVPYIGDAFPATFDRSGTGVMETGYFNFIVQPLRGLTGQVERVLIHAVEITEQIVARKRAEESEVRFRTLADNISQFAWMADEKGWVFWYNQRWYDYTGTTLQEMQGWGWQQVHHPDHVARVVEKIRHCFATGEIWEDTFPLRGKDGTYRWFLSRAIPIRDEHGVVMRWFGTNTDITEQKHLEQQKDEFLGIASHELKTPVTSLKGYTQLLERRFRLAGDDNSSALLKRIDAQINKLTHLINDLLDVTKIESGHLLFRKTTFDWNTLIQEVVEEIQHTASGQTIVLQLAPSVMIFADRDRIGQVLTNLLTNALKYASQTKTIIVKTVLTERAIISSVQDFGIGISKEKQAHVFERFFRVEGDTQQTYPGLGLGLYISAEFVKRHHGNIWVESQEGEGTTMTFSLPLQCPSQETGERERETA